MRKADIVVGETYEVRPLDTYSSWVALVKVLAKDVKRQTSSVGRMTTYDFKADGLLVELLDVRSRTDGTQRDRWATFSTSPELDDRRMKAPIQRGVQSWHGYLHDTLEGTFRVVSTRAVFAKRSPKEWATQIEQWAADVAAETQRVTERLTRRSRAYDKARDLGLSPGIQGQFLMFTLADVERLLAALERLVFEEADHRGS